MVARKPLNSKEIIELLSRLKSETPEYPVDMLAVRKANFLRQVATLKIQIKDQGDEGGLQGGSHGPGSPDTITGGMPNAQSIIFQAIILLWVQLWSTNRFRLLRWQF